MLKENMAKVILAIVFTLDGLIFTLIGVLIAFDNSVSHTGDKRVGVIVMLLLGGIFLLLGLIFIALIIREKINESILEREGIKKQATVIDYEKSNFRVNREELYKLLVVDDDGRFYTSKAYRLSRLSYKYKVNDKVKVLIHPDNNKIYKVMISVE